MIKMRKAVAELAEALRNDGCPSDLVSEIAEAWQIPELLLQRNFERRHGALEEFISKSTATIQRFGGWIGKDFALSGEEYIFLGIAPRSSDHIDTFRARRLRDGEEVELSWGELHERVRPQLED